MRTHPMLRCASSHAPKRTLVLFLVAFIGVMCIGCQPLVLEVRITEESIEPTPIYLTPLEPTTEQVSAVSLGYNASFIEDISIPDDTDMMPGQPFAKTWRVRNTGWTVWRDEVRLELQYGNLMGTDGITTVSPTAMGDSVEITIEMVAPMEPGWHISYWQLCTDDGLFGPEMWVSIWVDGMSASLQSLPQDS